MRLRGRRPLVVAVALVAGVGGAVAVGSPAMAYDLCFNHFPTMTITSAGSYSGTSGNDIVVIKHTSGMVYYNPVDGHDEICRLGTAGTFTVWAAGKGHKISAAGPSGVTIYGSEGADDIGGSSGNDVIKGNGGNDIIWGYGGDDYIRGGDGDDYIFDEFGSNCLLGGKGYNQIYGYGGNNTILLGYDNRYSDTQCAPATWDTSPAAETFRNTLHSGGGVAHGGSGNDIIYGSNGADYLNGGAGNDVIRGFNGNDSLTGGTGSDNLNGGYGNDSLSDYGDSVTDYLYGGPGTDTFHAYNDGVDVCYPEWGPATMACGFGVTG